jgi:Domain of unknown function (DUF4062)
MKRMKADSAIKVFVSSKQAEFKCEREGIFELVSGMPLLAPILAEDWSPGRDAVKSRYLRNVRESPIYVGLFGCIYSAPTEEEYRAALENPFREVLVYVRECDRADAGLLLLRKSFLEDCIHTVTVFKTWDDLKPVFERHLWNAVYQMIQAYMEMAKPQPQARGEDSVMLSNWKLAKSQLTELGLPGSGTQEDAIQWAQRLRNSYPRS